MDDYLGWLTSGLIFLWILGAHDARAAPVELGAAGCESSSLSASPSADPAWASNGGARAADGWALRGHGNAAWSRAGNESRH